MKKCQIVSIWGGVTLLSNQSNLDCKQARTRLGLVLLCGAKYED